MAAPRPSALLPPLLLVALAGVGAGACDSSPAGVRPDPSGEDSLRLEVVATGLVFPTFLASPPGDADRLFVTEKAGRVRVIERGALRTVPFLDLTAEVSRGGEQGLLSLAFHPSYAQNRRLYLYLTDPAGDVRVLEYRASATDPARADPATRREILRVPQPYANHNGGLAAFGPDGYLYLGLGDGGGAGDPLGAGQDTTTLLGALLRIDVDRAENGLQYAVPPDNPFRGRAGARAEIWSYGLRNPWRFSFDRASGDLYLADVGQNRWEEVNSVSRAASRGANFGWKRMEGSHCFGASTCDRRGLVLPVLEYDHAEGCSVTGGYVYRGSRVPSLRGTYFYGDFCGGWVRSFRVREGEVVERRDWTSMLGTIGNLISFGEDAAGEVYLLTADGRVLRLAPR